MKKPRIVVVGSANTDMVVQVETIPHLGETVLGGKFVIAQGGKGANQAVAAARLGAEVIFVARLGCDSFGQESLSAYLEEGIRTEYISIDDNMASGVALIMINRNGDNIIAVAPGANGQLSSSDVQAAESAFQAADALLLQLEIPMEAVQTAIDLALKYHIKVILNPAPATHLPDEIIRSVDFLTPNEAELSMLAGNTTDPGFRIAKDFAHHHGVQALVVTLGAKGAYVLIGDTERIVPGYPVIAIDTVAAGDAFNGALAVALSRGDDPLEAVRFANAVGAISVTRVGAQPSLPKLVEVIKFLAEKKV